MGGVGGGNLFHLSVLVMGGVGGGSLPPFCAVHVGGGGESLPPFCAVHVGGEGGGITSTFLCWSCWG